MAIGRRLAHRHRALAARRRPLAALGATLLVASLVRAGTLGAFEDLNAAQTLVYDVPHLVDTAVGDTLTYRYRAEAGGGEPIGDRATLLVDGAPDAERRDVTLDFLSDERRLELPPFAGYRGNPILIATLEHVAQSLAAKVGGGALYVRNRIRDALARDDASITEGTATHGNEKIGTTTLVFEPFANDAFLGARPGYGDATIRIVFSDEIPGGVLSIGTRSGESGADAGPDATFDYELHLDDDAT